MASSIVTARHFLRILGNVRKSADRLPREFGTKRFVNKEITRTSQFSEKHARMFCTTGRRESKEIPLHSLQSQTQFQIRKVRKTLPEGPSLEHFIANNENNEVGNLADTLLDEIHENVPYVDTESCGGYKRKVFFETYGCQMNINDTEVVWAILKQNGFLKTENIEESDVILLMTCAIREGAETKIWNRLEYLKYLKRKRLVNDRKSPLRIGVLGCMAERLKIKIVEKEQMVDLVCGPDAYRDLPRMLSLTESGQAAVNVLLSLDETYADIIPVRLNKNSTSAFVSIMRGCDNMCTYCIVPFTRGRERSRPISSILDEVRTLSDQGIKEVTLLGQNVNSFRDVSDKNFYSDSYTTNDYLSSMRQGFKTVYKSKVGGKRFVDLLNKVSQIDPEMRIRFTSPHPKDFPDEVLDLIKDRPNICNQLHLPAQSGSTVMLTAMRRGYSLETYLDLVYHIKEIIPDVALSSDFIAGFCGETEEMHQETISLIKQVQYNFAYCFPYSMREKTRAFHKLNDDVPEDVKKRRHQELVDAFRKEAKNINKAQIRQQQLVLLEGDSKRSSDYMAGRNDANTKVILPKTKLSANIDVNSNDFQSMKAGDYVVAEIEDASSQVLIGNPLYHTTLQEFYHSKSLSRKNSSTFMQGDQ